MNPVAPYDLVTRIEREVRPLLDRRPHDGGYNCCGCSTYDEIIDHIIRIIEEEE